MTKPFTFDRSFEFAVPPAELWTVLARTDEFPRWWQWLRGFDIDGTVGLEPGVEAACTVRGPLPYSLQFTVRVLDVVPESLVATEVTGDIEGPARLELEPTEDGTSARVSWAVRVVDPALRATSRVARPLMEWGHDWVVGRGVSAFRRNALDGGG